MNDAKRTAEDVTMDESHLVLNLGSQKIYDGPYDIAMWKSRSCGPSEPHFYRHPSWSDYSARELHINAQLRMDLDTIHQRIVANIVKKLRVTSLITQLALE